VRSIKTLIFAFAKLIVLFKQVQNKRNIIFEQLYATYGMDNVKKAEDSPKKFLRRT
jgi:hypothetical protein